MNDQTRLLIASQILPTVFLGVLAAMLLFSCSDSEWYMVEGVWQYTTTYAIAPGKVISNFLQGIVFVLFFSIIGIFWCIILSPMLIEPPTPEDDPEPE